MRETQGITEAILLLSVGSLLTICLATLIIAIMALRHARRYVVLAEERMEHLREEQTRLLMLVREVRQGSHEEPEQEWEQLLETRWEHERREQEHRARRDAERKIDQVRRELLGLPPEQQQRQESPSPSPLGSSEDTARSRGRLIEKSWPTQKVPRAQTSSRAQGTSKPAQRQPEDEKQPLVAVWHPHPDDDVSPGSASTGQTGGHSDVAPLRMFHRYYDRYLDNYEGYVKLAERLYLARDRGEVPPGSAAEWEWEERLRRANDGIQRTTARLDLLEEYNPELATDDRVSRRASIARSASELGRSWRPVEKIKDPASS